MRLTAQPTGAPQSTSPRGRGAAARLLAILATLALVFAACADDATVTDDADSTSDTDSEATSSEDAVETDADAEADPSEGSDADTDGDADVMADGSGASFVSLQFAPVEEAEKFRSILAPSGIEVTIGEEGPTVDQILADSGAIDVVGALHGAFPTLVESGKMINMADTLDDLSDSRSFAPSMVQAGLLGSDDNLAYVPWAQATYIMAANTAALDYLPDGANLDTLTWDEFAAWCQAIADGEGSPKCGLPKAGLFHRFLEGYLWPSYTGGMVSEFRSAEAVDMMTYARDDLWPTLHPESISYEFMQEPLLSGDVWVAFDHVARLIDAFTTEPDTFVAFPTPAGPAGRGFMPVIVGLGIPADAPNPDEGKAVIEYLTRPDVQAQVLADLAFFPVVDGADMTDLPEGVKLEAEAVNKLLNAPDGIPALLPVGLGERGGEINDIFRSTFDRIVIDGEDIASVLDEQGQILQTLMDETGAPCWSPDPASDGPCQVAAAN